MRIIKDLKPSIISGNTGRSVSGSNLTYNESGDTYNEVGVTYGGVYGTDLLFNAPVISKVFKPRIIFAKTGRLLSDDGISYNESGVTYNDSRYTYGGLYGKDDYIKPLMRLIDIKP